MRLWEKVAHRTMCHLDSDTHDIKTMGNTYLDGNPASGVSPVDHFSGTLEPAGDTRT